MSYSRSPLKFEKGYSTSVLEGESVSRFGIFCRCPRLPSWPIIQIIVIPDHSKAMAAGHMLFLEFTFLGLMRFLVVVEHGALGYDCLDLSMGHGGCGRITSPFTPTGV